MISRSVNVPNVENNEIFCDIITSSIFHNRNRLTYQYVKLHFDHLLIVIIMKCLFYKTSLFSYGYFLVFVAFSGYHFPGVQMIDDDIILQ